MLISASGVVTCDVLDDDDAHLPSPNILRALSRHQIYFLSHRTLNSQRTAMSNGAANLAAQEKVNVDIVTLTRFLTEEQRKHKEATGDFTYIIPHQGFFDQQADKSLTTACYAMLFNSHSSPLLIIYVEQV